MAITHVTEATVGAPNSGRISGTNGDLGAMLSYAVQLQGWAQEYQSSNNWVLRPATGNRFRLWLQDDSAISGDARFCVVRGVESASSASSVTDPFPTSTQVPNSTCNWIKSTTANTTARNFDIFVGDTWLFYAVNLGSSTNIWEIHWFGDISPFLSADTYGTMVTSRRSNSTTAVNGFSLATTNFIGVTFAWLARSYDGTVKSTQAAVPYLDATIGAIGGAPQYASGPSTKLDRMKMPILDIGATSTSPSSSLSMPLRGWFPNLWLPLHGGRGIANTRDTIQDTSYNASANFEIFTVGNTAANGFILVETTSTWSKPLG